MQCHHHHIRARGPGFRGLSQNRWHIDDLDLPRVVRWAGVQPIRGSDQRDGPVGGDQQRRLFGVRFAAITARMLKSRRVQSVERGVHSRRSLVFGVVACGAAGVVTGVGQRRCDLRRHRKIREAFEIGPGSSNRRLEMTDRQVRGGEVRPLGC